MKHIFIIGSRGLPAKYGGFETFVEELVKHRQSPEIYYHVACLSDDEHQTHFDYLGVDCFTIKAKKIGPARVIAYDIQAIQYALKLIKEQDIEEPIFYVLGNTIGPFIGSLAKKIKKVGGKLYVNPDGLEWKRSKWAKPIQWYLKKAEKDMTVQADLVISDNEGIESYIRRTYPWSKTHYIAYGTDLTPTSLLSNQAKVKDWYQSYDIKEKEYYLIVGRFVPENNYEKMIKEFMTSKTERDLVIIANHEGNAYYKELLSKTKCQKDKRVKFVGTVYDRDLLKYIRSNAYAYIHGHEVGGTNPGLLEALAQTNVNLVLDVDFNRQVAQNTALYWTKKRASLKKLIHQVELNYPEDLGGLAKKRMEEEYTWEKIVKEYEDLFSD